MTELARTRAQKGAPTFLITLGTPEQPAIATTRIVHTPAGIEEHTTLVLGYRPDDTVPPDTALSELAQRLTARHNLATLFVTVRPARCDLTAAPNAEHSPAPLTPLSAPCSAADAASQQ